MFSKFFSLMPRLAPGRLELWNINYILKMVLLISPRYESRMTTSSYFWKQMSVSVTRSPLQIPRALTGLDCLEDSDWEWRSGQIISCRGSYVTHPRWNFSSFPRFTSFSVLPAWVALVFEDQMVFKYHCTSGLTV